MKNDNKQDSKQANNVIDMTERIHHPDALERIKGLKVRFDLEHAKIALSTSLLSIVLLVTLANNNLMNGASTNSADLASQGGSRAFRGIASVPSATVMPTSEESQALQKVLVSKLSSRDLSASASIGRMPSSIEKLAFEKLEGKYAIRLNEGKISEIEFSQAEGSLGSSESPKRVEDFQAFLDSQRELLMDFDKSVRVSSSSERSHGLETYQLVNKLSLPVAKVQFEKDSDGRMLAMRVTPLQVASK